MNKSMLTAALIAMLLTMLLSVPAIAQEDEPFTDSITASPDGIGEKIDLSQYTLTKMDGEDGGTLADFNKYIYVDVWATWCGPCTGEIPNLLASQEKLGGDDFTIIGLSIDAKLEDLIKFFETNDQHYPIFHDADAWKAKFAQDFKVHGIPALFLFAPDGTLIGKNFRGTEMPQLLEDAIKRGTEDMMDARMEAKFDINRENFTELMEKKPYDYVYKGKENSGEFWVNTAPLKADLSFELTFGELPEGRDLLVKVYAAGLLDYVAVLNGEMELDAIHDFKVDGKTFSSEIIVPEESYIVMAEAVLIDPADPENESSVKHLRAVLGGLGVKSK